LSETAIKKDDLLNAFSVYQNYFFHTIAKILFNRFWANKIIALHFRLWRKLKNSASKIKILIFILQIKFF